MSGYGKFDCVNKQTKYENRKAHKKNMYDHKNKYANKMNKRICIQDNEQTNQTKRAW